MDIIRNMKIYNLYNIFNCDEIINKLGQLPLVYKENMKYFNDYINKLKNKNKPFKNYIENYFVKNKKIKKINLSMKIIIILNI